MMYIIAVMVSIVMTFLSQWFVKLVERKAGGQMETKIVIPFKAVVFVLFTAANLYMAYLTKGVADYILLNIMLTAAVVSSYQDLKYREIEDEVHVAAFAAGFAGLVVKGFEPVDFVLGLLVGGGTLLLIAVLPRGGMGGADIKLNAVYGAVLGLRLSVLSLLIGFVTAALVSLLLMLFKIKGRKDVIPFSPFLSFGALISFIFGNSIINAYVNMLMNQ